MKQGRRIAHHTLSTTCDRSGDAAVYVQVRSQFTQLVHTIVSAGSKRPPYGRKLLRRILGGVTLTAWISRPFVRPAYMSSANAGLMKIQKNTKENI